MSTRYYVGHGEDLDELSRQEVISLTHEHHTDAVVGVEDMLDDIYGPIQVLSLEYSVAEVLKATDPTAWRVLLSEEIQEIELEDYENGEEN